jgi:hypothetical protein
MYEYLGQYYLSLNEMLEDIRYDYVHGDRDAAMSKLDDLNMHLTGI